VRTLTNRIVALTAAVALVAATVSGAAAFTDDSFEPSRTSATSTAPNAQTQQQLSAGDDVVVFDR
jgi:hypothetical protein